MKPIWWHNDYETIRDRVGCVELTNWSCIELRGPDRARLLNSLGTNRLDDIAPGEGRETFLTDPRGHVVAHGMVFADEESTLFVTATPRGDTISDHLNKYIVRENVQVVDRSVQTAMWYCGGHTTQDLLERLGIPVRHREPGEHVNAALKDAPVKAARVDITGPAGFLLVIPREHARSVAGVLQQADVRTCVREAFDSARIQWGWPLDLDISRNNFPQEVGRDHRAISFTKGCYLGQETVARIDSLGHVNKQLTLVHFPAGQLTVSANLFAQGKPAGTTTSMGYSPEFSCPVALAYVRREWAEPGTVLESSIGRAETVPFGWLASVS